MLETPVTDGMRKIQRGHNACYAEVDKDLAERALVGASLPVGTMAMRAIVPRTVSVVNLTRKALRQRCRQERQNMSTNIIKASVSLVALATSAGSLFVISWIGLALLGY